MDIDAEMQRAYVESTRLVASALPGAETAQLGNWFVYDANVDNPDFNIAAVAGDPAIAAREAGQVAAWYTARGIDFRWKLRIGFDDPVIAAIAASATEAPRREPYLWLPLNSPLPSFRDLGKELGSGVRVERVTDSRTLDAYDAFDTARGRPREWSVARAVMKVDPCSLWLAWIEDQVVARAMAVATRPFGTIANVVVGEPYRRRGIGTAITAAAAGACAEAGSTGVCLGASRMGYPLYLTMGFEHRYDLSTWTPRQAES